MKILIVAPAWLGDMIMAHALIRVLHMQYPEAIFAVLAPKSTLAITELMPEVNQRFLLVDGHGEFSLKRRWQLAREIRTQKFDAAYVLPNTMKSSLIPFLAGIPKRIGWKGEGRYFLLNDLRHGFKALPLMVERYVALAYPAGEFVAGNSYPFPKLDVPDALKKQVIKKFNLTFEKKILALTPGAAYGPAKKWPAEYFAEVACVANTLGWQVWIIGTPNELETAEEIMRLAPKTQNFAGQTSLLEMAAMLALSDQVVCNDSGPMHIAASFDKPLVAIFGSSSSRFTPPLGNKVCILEKNDLSCRPCFQRTCRFGHYACLREITPIQVLQALKLK